MSRNEQHKYQKASQSGFTLMEIMVALGILGIGMFVMVVSHHSTLKLYVNAQEDANARLLFERVLGDAEIKVMTGELTGEGDFGPRYAGYTYNYKAQLVKDGMPGFFEITANIIGPEEEHTLKMYVFGSGDKWEQDAGKKKGNTAKSDGSKKQKRT